MFCQINRDSNTKYITSVTAPNGKPSILYNDILKSIDVDAYKYDGFAKAAIDANTIIIHKSKSELKKELALIEWARIYDMYGTGTNDNYDVNGEFKFNKTAALLYIDVNTGELKTVTQAAEQPISNTVQESSVIREGLTSNSTLSRFASKMSRLFNVNIHFISEFEAKEILSTHGQLLGDNNSAFFLNGEIYLIEGRADMQTLVHEVAHPFIEMIYQTNRTLYNKLKSQITPELYELAKQGTVDKDNVDDIYKEAMAMYVGDLSNEGSLLTQLWNYISALFSKLVGKEVSIGSETTLESIFEIISQAKQSIDLGVVTAELNKVWFETREPSDLLNRVYERSKLVDNTADKTGYLSSSGTLYTAVNRIINVFTGVERLDINIAEHIAKKLWDDRRIDASVKLFTKDFPTEELDKATFIKKKEVQIEYAIKKGTIMHKLREWFFSKDTGRRSELQAEIQAFGDDIGISNAAAYFGWSIQHSDESSILRKILKVEGINLLDDSVPAGMKDTVRNEVKVFSDILGWAGTIDSLYEHLDGKLSIIDMYTGGSFNKSSLDRLLQYGNQALSIEDNIKNRKKLQIMLYAFIIKTEFPEAQFKNLKVHWMPNDYTAVRENADTSVDVESFLQMIEEYLIAEQPKVYAAVKAKSPSAFNPSEYSSTPTNLIYEANAAGKTLTEQLEIKRTMLTNLLNKQQEFINRNRKRSITVDRDIEELTRDIAELGSSGMTNILDTSRDDETVFKKAMGQFGDFADKKLQNFKLFMDSRRFAAEKEKAEIKRKLSILTNAIRKDYLNRTGKAALSTLTVGQIDTLVYKDLYGKMFRTKAVGELSLDVLVTKDDAEWLKLTKNEQDFLLFISTTMNNYNNVVLNKIAYYDHNNRPVTFLQVLRKSGSDFKLNDASFLPRTPMLDDELREEAGILSKDHFEKLKNRMKQRYLMSNVQETDQFGIPLKYYGSMELIDSETWSRNLEHAFLGFTENLIDKIYMDDVIAYGKGIVAIYNADIGSDGQPTHKNNMQFLEDKILLDIVNRKDSTDVSRTGLRIPVIDKKLNVVAVLGGIRRLTSKQIMWLKPFQGAANGVMARMVTKRRAVVTSLLGEGSFGYKDTLKADAEVAKLLYDIGMGNKENNKTWLLLEEMDYLPSDFGYNTPVSELVTAKNKGFDVGNMYLFHTMFEKANAITIMVAQMHRMKTTKNGQEISMFDAYDTVTETDEITGRKYTTLKYTGDVRGAYLNEAGEPVVMTGITSNEVSKMKRVYQQMQGGYRADEKSTLELYWWGQMLMQFRKYLPSLLLNALKSKNDDYTLGHYEQLYNTDGSPKLKDGQKMFEWVAEETEGAIWVILKSWTNLASFNKYYKSYSVKALKSQKHNEKLRALLEGHITAATFILIKIALGALFPDDDDEKDETRLLLHRVADNYSQHYNPADWFKTLKSPPAAIARTWLTMQASVEFMTALAFAAAGDDEHAYTRYGRIKGGTELLKSIPVVASVYSFHKVIGKSEWSEQSAMADWFEANINLAR